MGPAPLRGEGEKARIPRAPRQTGMVTKPTGRDRKIGSWRQLGGGGDDKTKQDIRQAGEQEEEGEEEGEEKETRRENNVSGRIYVEEEETGGR